MTKRLGFRNYRDERGRIDSANRGMELMFGDLREAKGIAKPAIGTFTPKRRIPRGGGDPGNATDIDRVHAAQKPLEGPVVSAIKELLAVHPRVLFACRQNGGAASYEAKSGRYAPVKFYEIVQAPEKMTVVDFWGLLIDGRMFAVEAKRPGWTKPTCERERRQAAFIAMVRHRGGIAIFATDAAQVAEALK